MTRLMLIRHAPALDQGRLAGRRDVPADLSDRAGLAWLRARISANPPDSILASPARRCMWTGYMLTPHDGIRTDSRLWEQDFGAWEGLPLTNLPDTGPLTDEALANHRPPGGESFADLVSRTRPVLESITGTGLIFAHAGTVRAALSLVTGPALALRFQVAPLSLTILRRMGKVWAVECVNATAPDSPAPSASGA